MINNILSAFSRGNRSEKRVKPWLSRSLHATGGWKGRRKEGLGKKRQREGGKKEGKC